ncbi:MAG: hypothetical protein ACXW2P_12085, partial [Thermoanaerobaculia bacterium]
KLQMPRPDLLPGVVTDSCPPVAVIGSRETIVRARRRAIFRDVTNLVILSAVDYVALRWPSAHIPLVNREQSMLLVGLLNATVITHIVMTRVVARLAVRRIAATWSLRERARFSQTGPL